MPVDPTRMKADSHEGVPIPTAFPPHAYSVRLEFPVKLIEVPPSPKVWAIPWSKIEPVPVGAMAVVKVCADPSAKLQPVPSFGVVAKLTVAPFRIATVALALLVSAIAGTP